MGATATDLTYGRYGDMLHEYYIGQFEKTAQVRQQKLSQLKTRADALNYVLDVRQRMQQSFGAFPERTPLNARVVKQIETKRYLIDNVIFESRPGFEVTANFYRLKDIKGKVPGVLLVLGHDNDGKFCYQDVGQRLAMSGYAVLIVDPIGQGERKQFDGKTDGVEGCCAEHNMLGKKLQLLGENFSMWRLWDALRGMDYLLTRPEVDPNHVGVTGCSGGGTLTSYVTAFEPRLTMAAPCCYITTMLHNLENELPTDSEQNPPKFQALGLDIADFVIASAPRPTVILAQNNDFFDCRGAQEVYQVAKKIYGLLGKAGNIKLIIGEGQHGYPVHHQINMRQFFNTCTGLQEPVDDVLEDLTHDQLDCYKPGQSRGKTVQNLLDEMLAKRPKQAPKTKAELANRAREILKLEAEIPVPDYRIYRIGIHELNQEHLEKESYCSRFALKTEPGVFAMLKQLTKKHFLFQPYNLPERVTLFVPHLATSPEMIELGFKPDAEQMVFSCEVRGIGETRPTETSTVDKRFFISYGSDFMYACSALMLDKPYLGRKVFDLLSAVKLLAANGVKDIDLVGNGQGAVVAAFAALYAPEIKTVTLHQAPESYASMVTKHATSWPMSLMPLGTLKVLDLPEVYKAINAKIVNFADEPSEYKAN